MSDLNGTTTIEADALAKWIRGMAAVGYTDDEIVASIPPGADLGDDEAFRLRVVQAARKPVVRKYDAPKAEPPRIVGRRAADLLASTPETPDWIVPKVLARDWTIKVAAREKTGKGTLAFYVFGCLERGEATVFGPAARDKITTLIYTEEPEDSTREKVSDARLADSLVLFSWELTQLADWKAKVDYLVKRAGDEGHGLLFIDNVSRAAGVEDENGVELARAAEYLSEKAKAAGLAVWLDHHHKKGGTSLEDKSRGGTAMAGAMDNNVEMERVGGWDSRVRRLSSRGRLSATVWTMQVALSEDRTSYDVVADDTQPQTVQERRRLKDLEGFPDGVTAERFAQAVEVSKRSANRILDDFVSKGWARRDEGAVPFRWYATGEGLDGLPFASDEHDDAAQAMRRV